MLGGILSFLIINIANVVGLILGLYKWMLIVAILITWVNPDPYNPIVQFLRQATEPFLYKIRKTIPIQFGGMDFSPIIAILIVEMGQTLITGLLSQFAMALR